MEEAIQLIERHSWSMIFCHMNEKGDEVTLLRALKRKVGDSIPIIMTAAQITPQAVLKTILNGAFNFIGKPYGESEIRELSRLVRGRLQAAERESNNCTQNAMRESDFTSAASQFEIVGKGKAITKVATEIARALRKDHDKETANVERKASERPPTFLITGETGTGKELVARAIHSHSRYASGPFVAVNCSNLPAELADAELFGSTPGAYTGAARELRPGLWESAAGGTFFLDEITEAPPSLFPKLLRVLQDGRIKRLGANQWVKVNVQIVAASNRDVAADVKRGYFREDLYHRLSQHQIHLPPLRERLEDVPLLAAHFAHQQSAGTMRFAQDALHLLMEFSREYAWHGNVRELENVIHRAVAHAPDRNVYAVDLAPHLPAKDEANNLLSLMRESAVETAEQTTCVCGNDNQGGLDEQMRHFRNSVIKETLAAHNNCRTHAAKSLQISRSTMHRLIEAGANKSSLK